jgi:hypothetical protein
VDRWVVLLALAACEPTATAREPAAPPPSWVVAPAPSGFPLGPVTGRFGRSQPTQPLVELGIASAGDRLAPLRLATVSAIPGDGPARAVLYGSAGDEAAIDLVEVDRGRVLWRDTRHCAAPIVGATAEAIVCADAGGTRAIGLRGERRWSTHLPFIAFTAGRVAISEPGVSIILDASSGRELARLALPPAVSADAVVASCGDAGRELFAFGDGKLLYVAEADGRPAIRWAAPIRQVLAIDACEGEVVVVTESAPAGASLVAIDRATGKIAGRLDGVVASWPARDGSGRLEVSTARGVARHRRDLGAPEPIDLPPLGELLASRGDRRLVRVTPLTAVLLDRDGVRAYLPLAAMGAVLGDRALIATSWVGSAGETAHRFGLPPRWNRRLRVLPQRSGVAVDAELRDLPLAVPLETGGAIARPGTGMHAVAAVAIDPADTTAVFAIAVDGERAALVGGDLSLRRWRWQRDDGCGPGTPVALAVAREVVVCGTRGSLAVPGAPATVRATGRDGAARWSWVTDHLDAVAAAGDIVVVHAADRITVIDARDGRVRGHLASDDGAAMRAAVVAIDDATLVVTAERGRIVARLGLGMLPVWSLAVAGTVRALAPSGDGVLVALEDGDAYRVDARTTEVIALPGLGLTWHATGDVVTGHTLGGPIPGTVPPPPPRTGAQRLRRPLQILRGPRGPRPRPREEIDTPAPTSTPIAPPPSLGDSWQLTLYELTGGLRARNDYALAAPISPPAVRGPPGSPIVVAHGPGLRDVIVLDPRTGDPLRGVHLPHDAAPGLVFGTIVDGVPVAGTLLASPLRVVLF